MAEQKLFTPLFAILASLMTGLFFAVNQCTKMSSCALVFSAIILMANCMSSLFGAKKTILISFAALIVNLLLTDSNYLLNGQSFAGLVPISLLSIFCSIILAVNIITKFKSGKINLPANLLALMAGSLADMIVMSAYFANYFTFEKIIFLAATELAFKLIYSLGLVASLAVSLYLFEKKSHRLV